MSYQTIITQRQKIKNVSLNDYYTKPDNWNLLKNVSPNNYYKKLIQKTLKQKEDKRVDF